MNISDTGRRGIAVLVALVFLFQLFAVLAAPAQASGASSLSSAVLATHSDHDARPSHDHTGQVDRYEDCGPVSCSAMVLPGHRTVDVKSGSRAPFAVTLLSQLFSRDPEPLTRPPRA